MLLFDNDESKYELANQEEVEKMSEKYYQVTKDDWIEVEEENERKYSPQEFVTFIPEVNADKFNYNAQSITHGDKIERNNDVVKHPNHYCYGGIETIDFMRAKLSSEEFSGYCKGNVLKYVSRAGHKENEVEDLKKAQVYLGWLVDNK